MPTHYQSSLIIDGQEDEKVFSYRFVEPVWLMAAGVVNDTTPGTGSALALASDDAPEAPRMLTPTKVGVAEDSNVWTGWMFVEAGQYIIGWVWGSQLQDRVRFWAETFRV